MNTLILAAFLSQDALTGFVPGSCSFQVPARSSTAGLVALVVQVAMVVASVDATVAA